MIEDAKGMRVRGSKYQGMRRRLLSLVSVLAAAVALASPTAAAAELPHTPLPRSR